MLRVVRWIQTLPFNLVGNEIFMENFKALKLICQSFNNIFAREQFIKIKQLERLRFISNLINILFTINVATKLKYLKTLKIKKHHL